MTHKQSGKSMTEFMPSRALGLVAFLTHNHPVKWRSQVGARLGLRSHASGWLSFAAKNCPLNNLESFASSLHSTKSKIRVARTGAPLLDNCITTSQLELNRLHQASTSSSRILHGLISGAMVTCRNCCPIRRQIRQLADRPFLPS